MKQGSSSNTGQGQGHAPAGPAEHDPAAMIRDMRKKWLWTNFAILSLGVWLMTSPATFGYANGPMLWSDLASGALLAGLAGLALFPRFDFAGCWGVALVGTWLQAAPLVFWAPDAAAYVNDTLIGALAIALSILIPMMPGMAHHEVMMQPGPEIAGALVLTIAFISMAEVFRAGRFLNVLLGAWLAAAPWLLTGFTAGARWSGLAAGLAVILLSLRRGGIRERYAGWDRYAAWPEKALDGAGPEGTMRRRSERQ